MLNSIKQEVPATPEQDFTPQSSVWVNGKFTISRGTNYDTYFLFHETQELSDFVINAEGEEIITTRQAVFALPVVVKRPVTYEKVVNAAERAAYHLTSDAEAISFTASLARRYRLNSQDDEALEHDRFMNEVLEQVRPLFK